MDDGWHGWVASWLALVVVPVAVVEDGGLEVFGPVVFFDANSDSEVVACAELRVWANEGSVAGGVGYLVESWW